MADSTAGVPKTIWFLWFQGLDEAPYVVRKCFESWTARNPGWRVVCLDDATLRSVASVDYSAGNIGRLTPQARSDLVRLDLLTHHGGVWADATTFCVQPLDDWLPQNVGAGFFAFHRPQPDRIISSWFLAAVPGNILASRMFERLMTYWGDRAFRNARQPVLVRALTRLLRGSPRTRGWWFSPLIRDWLAVSPYYAIMYMFEKLVNDDPDCARVWADVPKVSAEPPHRLYRAGLLSPASAELRAEIDRREVPVYKTTWHLGGQDIDGNSVLGYLLSRPTTPGYSPTSLPGHQRDRNLAVDTPTTSPSSKQPAQHELHEVRRMVRPCNPPAAMQSSEASRKFGPRGC